jgi:hypothetical protein
MQGFLKSLNELVASVHENKAYDTAERLDMAQQCGEASRQVAAAAMRTITQLGLNQESSVRTWIYFRCKGNCDHIRRT